MGFLRYLSMIWQSKWEIKTKMFEYCEGWKALYGDIDPATG